LVKDGPVQNVYIDANRFTTLYQSKGMDPRQVATEIGAKNYDEAVEAGTDLVIPMETFAEKVAPSDDLQEMMPDLRLGQDVPTAREAEEYAQNQEEILAQIRADAEAATAEIQTPELQAIKDAAVQELIDAGYEPRTADAYATVHTKAMMNLAERAGMTPQEMMDAFELSVTRPLPEVLTKNQAADLGIDPLIDRLRAGDLPQQKDVYGETLIDFLIKKGGVVPSGELIDVEKQRRGLIKPTGMNLDDAASLAVQAGYFTGRTTEEITADDLAQAIQEELGGNIQFAEGQINRELMALMNQLEGLDEFLRALNIDLEQIQDNAEVRRLIDQAARTIDDPQIQDAVNRLYQSVFHGTPHVFDRFSLEAIGTGEGAQAYGWGLYFASRREVAEFYRDALTEPRMEIFGKQIESVYTADIREQFEELYEETARSELEAWKEDYLFGVEESGGNISAAESALNDFIDATLAIAKLEYQDQNIVQPLLESNKTKSSESAKILFDIGTEIDLNVVTDAIFDTYNNLDVIISNMSQANVPSDMFYVTQSFDPAQKDLFDRVFARNIEYIEPEGVIYQVDIPEDAQLLDWDIGLDQQPALIRTKLKKAEAEIAERTKTKGGTLPGIQLQDYLEPGISGGNEGEIFYKDLSTALGSDQAASDLLNSIGIPGLRYLDGDSRRGEQGTHNYVIWDENVINIEAVNDQLRQAAEAAGQQTLFQSAPRDNYTLDMFGMPAEEGMRANPDQPELPFTEDEVPGTFAARTEVVKESTKQIGETIVQTPEQAAQAMAYLARGADERLDALVTDENGKPLAIVGSFKGTYNQSAVYVATLTSEAFRIKGAANIWFAHNHPSGNAKLSESDLRLHERLILAFRGSNITPQALFAIGGKSGEGREWSMSGVDKTISTGVTSAPKKGAQVPVVERILTVEDRLGPQISSPGQAASAVVELSGGENGVVLADSQNRPLAFIPIDPEEASELRAFGRMDKLYRAVSMANPATAFIANVGMSDAMARNIAGFLGSLDIRVLDSIEIENGIGISKAKQGYTYTETIFFQADAADRRGAIEFGPRVPGKKRTFNMKLFEKADLSTFLHESGHFYLEVMGDLAEMPQASQQLKDDYAKILQYLGAESRADITLDGKKEGSAEYNRAVEMHEKFARSNEAYLMEGKAPSLDLREIFQRFKNWLKQIYKTITSLNVELTDEVRAVFDRIYASDQEIEAAQAELEVAPVFLDAASAGMTEAEFEAYRASVVQATESGKEALQQKLMNQLMRERKAWWKEERAKVKEEVTAEVDALPIYQAFKELTDGETKLDRDELVARYGKEYIKRLPRTFKRIYAAEGGMPVEAAARLLGYGNADQFIKALVEMRPRREYIEAETDRVMRERHGDMLTDGTISDEAMLALHNSQREKVIAAELRALRRKQREVRPFVQLERQRAREERRAAREAFKMPPVSAFRRAARETIAETKVRDLEPQRYLNAQRKHNKESQKLVLQGKYKEAADAKQKELLNHFLYLESRKARDRADTIAKNMSKFDKKATRQRIGKAGKTYLEQIDAILDGYEFRRISLRALDRRAKLNEFVARQEAEGEPVNIPQSVLDDARQVNYRQLTVGELEAVNEAVQNIANLARIKNKLLFIAEKRELNEVAGGAIDHIRANSKKGKQRKIETALPSERLGRWAKGFMLIHTKFSTIFRQMDGWKDGGMMWDLIVRPLNDRANWETIKKTEATERLREIFTIYRGTDMFAKKFIPGLNQSMTLQGRLMVALNWGRAENRQRLIDGNKFTQTEIDAILDSLEERDWKFVKDIWEHLNSYWPDISEQYEKLYGIPPEKVEPLPFETKFGTMPGGYFPIKYDPIRSTQTQAQTIEESTKLMKSGAYVRSQTKNGYTKETLENLDRAIKLDFSSIYEHTSEVIHDLALREYLIDFNKVMNHRVNGTTLKDTINEYYGDQVLREINDTIRDVTAGDIIPQNAFESSLTHLRAGVSIAFMGWNLVTGLMQPLGLTQSMVRIGPKWVAKGIKKWGSNAVQLQSSAKVIYEKSEFMRTRYLTQNREINEIRNVLKRQGRFPIFKEGYGALEDSFFFFIIQFQKMVDFPTWFGQYEKSLAQGADEKKAIAMADQAVIQSQASGLIKDLAKIERGTGLMKIWTNFYSYFNTTLNLTQEAFGKTNFRNPFDIGRLASDVAMLLVVPAVLGFAIREAVRLLAGGEEKDEEELIAGLLREQVGYLMGTVVGLREFATIFDPRFGYAGPAGVRFIAEFEGLATQISQGDLDTALRKRAINSAGILLHFPSNQVNRILDGIMALEDERTESPAAVLFGLPR